MCGRVQLVSALFLTLFSAAPRGWADPPAGPLVDRDTKTDGGTKFVRLQRDDEGRPIAMEVAVVRYASKADARSQLTVDLIGAVHVADADYYRRLNRLFKSYDALLYELVAAEGTRIPRGGRERNTHPVAAVQGGMKSMLDLAFQLECIDYTQKNFVHADMSPAEFARTMNERGESFTQLFFRMMGQGLARQSKDAASGGDMRLLLALFSRDRNLQLKRLMAEQFEDLEGSMKVIDGPDGSTLIGQRNKRALEVLRKQIGAGKKRVGIFYGAGHMPDMERRLVEQFGLEQTTTRWLVAWDLRER